MCQAFFLAMTRIKMTSHHNTYRYSTSPHSNDGSFKGSAVSKSPKPLEFSLNIPPGRMAAGANAVPLCCKVRFRQSGPVPHLVRLMWFQGQQNPVKSMPRFDAKKPFNVWWWVSKKEYVHPDPWGNDPIWRAYFSNGLVQPPTSQSLIRLFLTFWRLVLTFSSSVYGRMISYLEIYPPWKLTYPLKSQFWRWVCLFPRWDMLVP